jgi:serine/threonine protein kinase
MLAGLIFICHPFFPGKDNADQLVKIAKILGTQSLMDYLKKYQLTLDEEYDGLIQNWARRPFERFIEPSNAHLAVPDAIDLLNHLLVMDHQDRFTAQEAMKHKYFDVIREQQKGKLHLSSGLAEPIGDSESDYSDSGSNDSDSESEGSSADPNANADGAAKNSLDRSAVNSNRVHDKRRRDSPGGGADE